MLWLLVAVRVVSNPLSNVFQKHLTGRSADPLFVVLVTHALLTVACLPLLLRLPSLGAEFWGAVAASALLAVTGNALLVAAMRRTDLSVLGPVNAYKAVVALVPAAVLLGETPGLAALSGIGLVVAGSGFLHVGDHDGPKRNPFAPFFRDPGVRLRFAALALTGVEAAFLKRAVLASDPLTALAVWSAIGLAVAAVAVGLTLRGRTFREVAVARAHAPAYLLLAATTALMQGSTLYVLGGFQVGPALALFQTSAVLSVLLGWRIFRESHIARRLAGSAVMTAGAAVIVLTR